MTGSKLDDSKGIGGTKTLKKLMTYVKTVFSFFFFSSLMSDYRRWGVEMVNMIQIGCASDDFIVFRYTVKRRASRFGADLQMSGGGHLLRQFR